MTISKRDKSSVPGGQEKGFLSKELREETISDVSVGHSGRSAALTRAKQKLDMKDGDSHFTNHDATVGPVNDMFFRIKMAGMFPYPSDFSALIHKTH
jgi:hypothetical protein